jgi:hypothetical protein
MRILDWRGLQRAAQRGKRLTLSPPSATELISVASVIRLIHKCYARLLNKLRLIFVLSVYLWLYSPLFGSWQLFHFLNLYTVGRTPWTGDQPVAKPLPTHRTEPCFGQGRVT